MRLDPVALFPCSNITDVLICFNLQDKNFLEVGDYASSFQRKPSFSSMVSCYTYVAHLSIELDGSNFQPESIHVLLCLSND